MITTSLHVVPAPGPQAALDNIQQGYNANWSCPLTPFENRVKVPIRAREKVFEGEDHGGWRLMGVTAQTRLPGEFDMTTAANKALIQRFYEEVWGKGHLELADEVFAPNYVRHDLRPTNAPPGPEGQKKIAADFRAAFPDLQITIDLVLAEGDLVAARWTMEGTNSGPWGNVPATGTHARFSGVNIFRLENGKVAEIWNHRDDLGLMQQLGVPIFAGSQPT